MSYDNNVLSLAFVEDDAVLQPDFEEEEEETQSVNELEEHGVHTTPSNDASIGIDPFVPSISNTQGALSSPLLLDMSRGVDRGVQTQAIIIPLGKDEGAQNILPPRYPKQAT